VTVPQGTLWEIEPHTEAKHRILRHYLDAWFPILSKFNPALLYVDGFAGPGEYLGGEDGSPIIALKSVIEHTASIQSKISFKFIEKGPDRAKHLDSLKDKLDLPKNIDAEVITGLFADKIEDIILEYLMKPSRKIPALVFIDPFGFEGYPLTLIQKILSCPSTEVVITFMRDAINRFIEHSDEAIVNHIRGCFGSEKAVDILQENPNRLEELRLLYQEQLLISAKFVRYFEIRNHRNRVIYDLFFATNHPKGFVKMKDAMWKVDPSGQFKFSDSTDPNQIYIFQDESIEAQAAREIIALFKGKQVTGLAVNEFIEQHPVFLPRHKTAALKSLEKEKVLIPKEIKLDGKKRRPLTYPPDASFFISDK